MTRAMPRGAGLLALLASVLSVSGTGITYAFQGRELPSDAYLWSHQMVAHALADQ